MGIFEKNSAKSDVKKLIKKVDSLVGEVYVNDPEVNKLLDKNVLSRQKYHIFPKNDKYASEEQKKLSDKLKKLGIENYYYLLEKGPMLKLYDFLAKEEIDEFFVVNIATGEQKTVFKEGTVGNFFTNKSYVVVRTFYNNVDVEKSVISRFRHRLSDYNKVTTNDFEKILLSDNNNMDSLDSLLKFEKKP